MLFPTFFSLLNDKRSRSQTLKFFDEALSRNRNRSQLQYDEKLVAGDGFLMNLTSVLQLLSVKIDCSKVDPCFLFSPDNILFKKDSTRIKFTSSEADNWLSTITSAPDFKWNEVTFSTRCFFQTLYAHHLTVIPCQRKYVRRLRIIRELGRLIDTFENNGQAQGSHSNRIKKCKEQMLRYHKAKLCAEAGLIDEHFLGRCVAFYNHFIKFLLGIINPVGSVEWSLPLPDRIPGVFAAYPDWFVEDLADFLIFVVQYCPQILEMSNVNYDYINFDQLILFIITMICSPNYISNPYVVAKFIEVVFLTSPLINQQSSAFHMRIISHGLAETNLSRALMKFYTDIETTGASSEFYDKFTIRYHISIIFKSFWTNSLQQFAIIQESVSENGKNFIKFINMLMNDTTFLLDEALVSLKRIYEISSDIKDTVKWNKQSREQRENRERQLVHDERQCRSYLTLAVETVDMLHSLTKTVKQPFLRSVSQFIGNTRFNVLLTGTHRSFGCDVELQLATIVRKEMQHTQSTKSREIWLGP